MKELKVENVSRLLNIMSNGVSPEQFIRELTVNSIEAIKRTKVVKGQIHWGVDPIYKAKFKVEKLMIVDNGDGMTPSEMESHLGTLAVEGGNKNHGETGNFGVGGKISALKQNPHGVVYKSKKNGKCYQMTISSKNGLYLIHGPVKISNKDVPTILRNAKSGTSVTLLGKNKNENTARRKNFDN
ncbi:MAG: ATP-binding protein [Halobacteriovoraceae bacterium]|nr:ATP-binding protein [Halobacteriovoraceae bacterium]